MKGKAKKATKKTVAKKAAKEKVVEKKKVGKKAKKHSGNGGTKDWSKVEHREGSRRAKASALFVSLKGNREKFIAAAKKLGYKESTASTIFQICKAENA